MVPLMAGKASGFVRKPALRRINVSVDTPATDRLQGANQNEAIWKMLWQLYPRPRRVGIAAIK
jgi:hypothetical protein